MSLHFFLRAGGDGDQDAQRPDARLLQERLTQRLGCEAADKAPPPARRVTGSRRAEF